LLPAALSDSINPCAFAVILILLWAVLSRFKSRRKVILTGLSFSLAIFLSYLLMWLWLYNILWNIESTFYFKLWVWILWIIIWLANLKDVFWYWKGFVMEVPFSWRPKMKKLIKKATSPAWWFIIWLIVSLFLLPCTSGPYLTVLWYLATENNSIQLWWYIYLIIYNIIFVLPMIIITIMISFWYIWIATLMEIKEEKTELIHLIVWILMLWLGSYVIWDSLI
jgi:cytochrome c biogenesis protein CcdA